MNKLSRKITFISLIRFTIPTILMMVAISLYVMIDGVFVSRLINTSALSAINIIFPLMNIFLAIAIMFATGGSAVVATQMGEGKLNEAKESFSLIVLINVIIGIIIGSLGLIFIKPIMYIFGANEAIYGYCRDYITPILIFTPCAMLQVLFQYFFVTAGKPMYALVIALMAGVVNLALDYVFIAIVGMGIFGAGLATGIGFSMPALFGLVYFFMQRKGSLYFTTPKFDSKVIFQSMSNGSSEMVTNLSTAVTTFLFNIMMMKYVGENGVAAITIVLYSAYLLTAIFLGYSSGIAPIFSYNYGKGDMEKLKKLFRISIVFISVTSIAMYIASMFLSSYLVSMFTKDKSHVYDMALNGFGLFAFAYLFMGVNIFASAMFTALSDGKISAIISFLRTFVFIVASLLLLPKAVGINGIWLAVPVAEVLTIVISLLCFYKLRKRYNYT